MVDNHYVVKLIDFGASKQQSTVGGATMSTGISYTNGYAPSEQMAQSYDKFGPWTDFYALGATVYKLLTNQDPPSVSDLSEDETEDKHLALPMPNVSEEMKKLVVWMMQVNRLKRPKNVGEIKRILQQPYAATSNEEETKAFSPHKSCANPVNDDEETVWEMSQVKDIINEDRQGGDEKKNTSNHGLKIVSVILAVGIAGLIMRAIYYGGSYDDAFERNMVHGLNTIDKFVSGGIIFLVFFVPIVSVVLYYVLKKYISWNSKFLLKDGR